MNKKEILNAYLTCALWTAELDSHSISDITKESIDQAKDDINSFIKKIGNHIIKDLDFGQVGHDFWLDRNHHGSGAWDRPFYSDELGKELTKIAQSFGEKNVFLKEDGSIIIE